MDIEIGQPTSGRLTMIKRWSLCTWWITYWMPDSPLILAPELVIQREDLPPQFPELRRYLQFWEKSIDGKLHSVRVSSAALITPAELRMVGNELVLN